MKQIITKFSLAILGLIAFSSINAQTVNMDRYITLTVQQGQNIEISCESDADNTDVRIVSGTTDSTITIGIYSLGNLLFAGATTMTIYGNVNVFYCDDNGIAITGLDVSHNSGLTELHCVRNSITSLDVSNLTQLIYLYCDNNSLTSLELGNLPQLEYLTCFNNNLSTSALDFIFCQLPQKEDGNYSWIMPIESDTSSNYAIVMATNKQNAINKDWKVIYNINGDDIPATTGAYVCNVGIEDVNNDIISAKIYPNPLTKDLTIEANENIEKLEVLNVSGKKVLNKEVNKNNLTLDFSTMNKGVYIIKLYSSKGERSYKVVKE